MVERPAAGVPAATLRPVPNPLAGLRVLVTGASSGIGALCSMMLAFGGCQVVGSGRRFAHSALPLVLESVIERDLTVTGAAADVVAAAASVLGGLDVVISNAGAGWSGPYQSMTRAELDAALDLNLRAAMHIAHAAAPHLLQSRGQIVFVGSIAGKLGIPQEAAYSAAKSGLEGLSEALRTEWHPRVAVTLVSPGVIETPFFARRNRGYNRDWPKPVPAARAARAVVRAVERRPAELYVPYWFAFVSRLHGALPGIYRSISSSWRGVAPG